MNNHLLANLDDIRDRFGTDACRELVAFDRAAKDRITPREFYHSDYPDGVSGTTDLRRFDTLLDTVRAPDARHYVETAIHSDLATEPRHTSLSYGLQNYLMNDPAYMLLYGIEGGNERLPRELAARIQADFRMEHRVSHIERVDNGQLRVRSVTATTTHEDDFDFVVVALPHSALESVTFTGDRLRTAIESHRDDYDFPRPLPADHDPVPHPVLADGPQRLLLDARPLRRLLSLRRIVPRARQPATASWAGSSADRRRSTTAPSAMKSSSAKPSTRSPSSSPAAARSSSKAGSTAGPAP